MDSEEKKLKIYEIFSRRITEETKEFYLVSSFFLVLLTAILELSKENRLLWIGFIGAIVWFLCNYTQIMWKRYWQGRNRKIENLIFVDELKSIGETEKKQPKLLYLPIHLTFIFSLLPIFFIFIFGSELNLFKLGLNALTSLIGSIFIILLLYASYLYTPFSQNNK